MNATLKEVWGQKVSTGDNADQKKSGARVSSTNSNLPGKPGCMIAGQLVHFSASIRSTGTPEDEHY